MGESANNPSTTKKLHHPEEKKIRHPKEGHSNPHRADPHLNAQRTLAGSPTQPNTDGFCAGV
ncbi:hypothetical protein BD410DRAFT_793822 [Rickenella mellea]|uniref:Uncharacterized protein n=1 Tax=Rickenella mellea TaxID=50990 RepID=A0A4Y7PR78_9AGAM|nr:hypothetical protein BD410DRAFT_793822 [Rickenella mellea]